MKFHWTAQYNLIAGWRPLAAWCLWIVPPTGHEKCICATETLWFCVSELFSVSVCSYKRANDLNIWRKVDYKRWADLITEQIRGIQQFKEGSVYVNSLTLL